MVSVKILVNGGGKSFNLSVRIAYVSRLATQLRLQDSLW